MKSLQVWLTRNGARGARVQHREMKDGDMLPGCSNLKTKNIEKYNLKLKKYQKFAKNLEN